MFYLFNFADIIPNSLLLGDRNVTWTHLSIDSRTIKAGELFIAIKGEKYDGHDFIEDVCNKGAAAVVLEKNFFQKNLEFFNRIDLNILLVEDTLLALQKWAHHHHSLYKPLDICITGSNGKTTTKEMITHILSTQFTVLKSRGNYNNEIGVPLTVLGLNSSHNVLVVEMAAQKLGEIKELTGIVSPDIAVVTNIGEAHIGLFENKDNIAREKSELFKALKKNGTAIINRDDIYYEYLLESVPAHRETISFGFHPESQVRAKNFRQRDELSFQFELSLSGNNVFQVVIPLLGRFNVLNALAAIAVCLKMGIPIMKIIESISNFKGYELHMEHLSLTQGITLIQDYYNANPTATKEALQSVSDIAQNRFKIAVLGDMLELGDKTGDYHKEIGRKAASLSYDMLITFGEYGDFIIRGAIEEGMPEEKLFCFKKEEKKELINWLIYSVPQNSIILLKGSRSMQMEDIVQPWKEYFDNKKRCEYA